MYIIFPWMQQEDFVFIAPQMGSIALNNRHFPLHRFPCYKGNMSDQKTSESFMRLALQQAEMAAAEGEVPVGAVIVHENRVIGKAHNQMETLKDATAHAEMIAITQACAALGDWRLDKTALYVTKEPCPMCMAAISLSRIPTVVFGAPEPEFSRMRLDAHVPEIRSGVLEDECRAVIQDFFRNRRKDRS